MIIRLLALAMLLLAAPAAAAAAPSPAAVAKVGPDVFKGEAFPPRKVAFDGGVTGLADLTYSSLPGWRPLKLDLYLPPARFKAKGPRPTIVFIHGGAWGYGTPRATGAIENFPQVLAAFAARGYVVASLSYRFFYEAPFPAAIQDVKTAVRWLRANASTYGVDKGRVLAWGPSAGGQLATLAAATCGGDVRLEPAGLAGESDCLQGAVSWYGIFDFAMDLADRTAALPPGASPRIENPYIACGPCTAEQLRFPGVARHLDAGDPPMLLIAGTADKMINPRQSQAFYDALRTAGVRAELLMLPGVDHSLIGPTPQATRAASVQALERTTAFIDSVIGDK
jgi:acetyl esterase/lipase